MLKPLALPFSTGEPAPKPPPMTRKGSDELRVRRFLACRLRRGALIFWLALAFPFQSILHPQHWLLERNSRPQCHDEHKPPAVEPASTSSNALSNTTTWQERKARPVLCSFVTGTRAKPHEQVPLPAAATVTCRYCCNPPWTSSCGASVIRVAAQAISHVLCEDRVRRSNLVLHQ